MFTAIKAVYNRASKGYVIEVLRDADVQAAHHGYLVYNAGNERKIAEDVQSGRLAGHLKTPQRAALLVWLLANVPSPA